MKKIAQTSYAKLLIASAFIIISITGNAFAENKAFDKNDPDFKVIRQTIIDTIGEENMPNKLRERHKATFIDACKIPRELVDEDGEKNNEVNDREAISEQPIFAGNEKRRVWKIPADQVSQFCNAMNFEDGMNILPGQRLAILIAKSSRESSHDPYAVGSSGELGATQILPSTFRGLQRNGTVPKDWRLFLGHDNLEIQLKTALLYLNYDSYENNPAMAETHYNCGPRCSTPNKYGEWSVEATEWLYKNKIQPTENLFIPQKKISKDGVEKNEIITQTETKTSPAVFTEKPLIVQNPSTEYQWESRKDQSFSDFLAIFHRATIKGKMFAVLNLIGATDPQVM